MLRSDLNLYLSRSFVLSWSVIEAIACGAPILTYDNKMLLELGETCRDQHPIGYVREGDIDALIEKIEKYVCAPTGRAGSGIDNLPRKLPNEWRRSLSSQRIIGLIKQLGASYF